MKIFHFQYIAASHFLILLFLTIETLQAAQKIKPLNFLLCLNTASIKEINFLKNSIDALTFSSQALTAANEKDLCACANLVFELLRRGADFNEKDPLTGITALHLACKNNNSGLIHLLLQHGVKPLVYDIHNQTPLHYAALFNAPHAIILLCNHTAFLGFAVDLYNRCPQDYARILEFNFTEELLKIYTEHENCNDDEIIYKDFPQLIDALAQQ